MSPCWPLRPGREEEGGEGAQEPVSQATVRGGGRRGKRRFKGQTLYTHTHTHTHAHALTPQLLTRAAWPRGLLAHGGQRLLPRSPVHLLYPAGHSAAVKLPEAEEAARSAPGEGPPGVHARTGRRTGLLSAGRWATQQPPRAPSSRLSDCRPSQAPTSGNRRLSPLAAHGDLGCPQHPERSLDQLDLCVPRFWGPFTATPRD